MVFLRPIILLFLILLGGFLLTNKYPELKKSLTELSSRLTVSNLENSSGEIAKIVTQKVDTIADNLPPPLKILNGAGTSTNSNAATLNANEVIILTNQERKANGNLAALHENAKLDAAALAKVKDMFAKQYFEHTSPSGVGVGDLAKAEGYQYLMVGENLALGNFASNQALLDAWMNSPGHRANILNASFTEMGAAVMQGTFEGRKVWLAVQEFGKPFPSCTHPDQSLLSTIQTLQADLNNKYQALQAKADEINNAIPKSGDAYNQKVAEYQSMKKAYDDELATEKDNIALYNKEVKSYNDCIGST